jgi:hypothetical protein
MPKIAKRQDSVGIKMTFDVPMLNALIKYIRCEYISQASLLNLFRLLKQLNLENYNYNPDIKDRLELLTVACEALLDNEIKDESVLLTYICQKKPDLKDLVMEVGLTKNQLPNSDCKYISDAINERLQYIYIYDVKDDIIVSLEKFGESGFTSYYDIINVLKSKLSNLMVKLNDVGAPDSLIRSLSFSGDDYNDIIRKIVLKAKTPSTVLMTGMRQLNAILSPGFQSGRMYLFLGGTGKFKSGTLWNIVDQLRQYNPQITPVEDGLRKTLLFVTMENTIYETILRLFDMYNDTGKEIIEFTPDEVIQILREKGNFKFTDSEGIDIEMRYYSDLEIATSHLYTLINELANAGKKVIALVLDYILKIDSTKEHYGDERVRLSYAGRELKALAQFYDIPVITAMQINREGNGILDAAMQENKEDIGRFIGASFVGQCWDLIQESDWVCFVNLEMQKSTGKWFLSFKRLKIRGKKDPLAVDYFNHPFVNNNGIRLEPDVTKERCVSIMSIASDLVSIDDAKESTHLRPKIGSSSNDNRVGNKSVLQSIDLSGLAKVA